MSPYDPKKPPPTVDPTRNPEGPRCQPPPAPSPEPAPPEDDDLQTIEPAEDQDELVKTLYQEHGDFILDKLRQRGISPDSAQDLRQGVVLVVRKHLHKRAANNEKPCDDVRPLLTNIARKLAANHRKLKKPEVAPETAATFLPSPSPNPERAAQRAELLEKVRRYVGNLSPEDRRLIQCLDVDEMTIKETAAALGLPEGTVITRHGRARQRLSAMARASEGAVARGERRKPGK
jgi:RNA polymerase sigma-70 factor (ECF subfamily)